MPNLGASQIGVNLMLVAGPRLDGARLTAAVHRVLPDASVTLRATALAALTTAPVLQAARTALTQGLATMGLRRWQAQLLLAAETLPPVVAAAIGGVACPWLLVHIPHD